MRGDYPRAADGFYRVARGETTDGAAGRQRAEFFLGKTLFQLGQFASIVDAGPLHPYYLPTLKWLTALHRILGD